MFVGMLDMILIIMGVIMVCFGGVICDVLVGNIFMLLKGELYVIICIVGGIVYIVSIFLGLVIEFVMIMVMLMILMFCLVVMRWYLMLYVFKYFD